MSKTSETTLEKTAMDWFETLGWQTAFGPDISPDLPAPNSSRQAGGAARERNDYDQVILVGRLQTAIENINPNIPPDAIEEAIRKIARADSPSLIENNRRFHRMLTDGVDISYTQDGKEVHDKVWLRSTLRTRKTTTGCGRYHSQSWFGEKHFVLAFPSKKNSRHLNRFSDSLLPSLQRKLLSRF